MTLLTEESYAALPLNARLLLGYWAFLPVDHVAGVIRIAVNEGLNSARAPQAAVAKLSVLSTQGLLAELARIDALVGEGIASKADRQIYHFNARLTPETYRRLAHDMKRCGVWPDASFIRSAVSRLCLPYAIENRYRDENALVETANNLLFWLTGEVPAKGSNAAKRTYYYYADSGSRDLQRATVDFLLSHLDSPESISRLSLAHLSDGQDVAVVLDQAALRGANVNPLMDWTGTFLTQPNFRPEDNQILLHEFVALSVWCGRARDCEVLSKLALKNTGIELLLNLTDRMRAGDWKAADKMLSGVLTRVEIASGPLRDATIFWMMAALVALRARAPLSRRKAIARHLADISGRSFYHGYGIDGERAAICFRNEMARPFAELMTVDSCSANFILSRCTNRCAIGPVGNVWMKLLPAIYNLFYGIEDNRIQELFADLYPCFREASAAGYATLAGLYVGLLGYAVPGRGNVTADEDALAASGAVWFWKGFHPVANWELALNELDEALPAVKAAVTHKRVTKSGTLSWVLSFEKAYPSEKDAKPNWSVVQLMPAFRRPRAPETGEHDKRLTWQTAANVRYAKCRMPADDAILAAAQKSRWLSDGRSFMSPPTEVVRALFGHPRILAARDSWWQRNEVPKPIEFRPVDATIKTENLPDGAIVLSVPTWWFDALHEPRCRKVAEDVWECAAFSDRMCEILQRIQKFGSDGKLVIPKVGIARATPVLRKVAHVVPLAGNLSEGAAGDVFPRRKGDEKPLVRLAFADDVLTVALGVRPIPERREFVTEAGAGQAERVVELPSGTVVLVRDLTAERRAAEKVRAALADFEAWAVGSNEWKIDSLKDALAALAALKNLGTTATLEWLKEKKLSVSTPQPKGVRWSSGEGADRWFTVRGQFHLDSGRVLSVVELIEALKNRVGEFLPFGEGEYLRLSSAMIRRLDVLSAAGRPKKDAVEVAPAALPAVAKSFEDDVEALPNILRARAAEYEKAFRSEVRVPERLKANLRAYQQDGYVWLSRLAQCGFGACLADDMGLGKTLQILAVLLAHAADGASLVIVPASVCGNWRNEMKRFTPTLTPVMGWDFSSETKIGPGTVVIVSYGLIVSREDEFSAIEWNGIVLDEAQAIKNDAAKRAKAVKRLTGKFRIVSTGTPVENRLNELGSIFEFINPGLLGPASSFTTRLTEEGRAKPALKKLVAPFILRRLKREVLDDLPPKTEITLPVELGEAERTAYEGCRRHALATLAEQGDGNRISILAELTRLRRFCCHPSLVLPDFRESAKLEALERLLSDLKANGHRALVFSQFTDYLSIVRDLMDRNGWTYQYLDGTTPIALREKSVDSFQQGEGDFFLISLKAGGMGLNLTAANYVILLDPWWNPAVEDQATDRVHRIGQKEPVTVYRLVAADTVEERVLDLHREKRAISDDMLDGTSKTSLTPDELMKLFS